MTFNSERIPIIGGLFKYTIKHHYTTFVELVLTLFFSFVPIFVAVLGDYLIEYESFPGIVISLINQISNGELFLFTTSLSAPIFYLVMRKRKEDAFPSRIAFIVLFIIIIGLSLLVFAFQRVTDVNPKALFNISIVVFFITIGTLYLVICYSTALTLSPTVEMESQTKQYSNSYATHRGGNR